MKSDCEIPFACVINALTVEFAERVMGEDRGRSPSCGDLRNQGRLAPKIHDASVHTDLRRRDAPCGSPFLPSSSATVGKGTCSLDKMASPRGANISPSDGQADLSRTKFITSRGSRGRGELQGQSTRAQEEETNRAARR